VPLPRPEPQMLAIAEKIVEQKAGDFDPSEFVDRYEDTLHAMIEDKREATVARPSAPATTTAR
jgi:DNA end-binding protein Ku